MCLHHDFLVAKGYFQTARRPAPAGNTECDGMTLLVETIARFWRLEDKYLSSIQLVSRRNLIRLLSQPMPKMTATATNLGEKAYPLLGPHTFQALAILVDDFFFGSQLGPILKIRIYDSYNIMELGLTEVVFSFSMPRTATIKLWTINKKGTHRSIGELFETLVHKMCHAYLSVFCCEGKTCDKGTTCRDLSCFKVKGISGHGPGWCTLMFALCDQVRQWETPFAKSFHAVDHAFIEETTFLGAVIGAFPPIHDIEEKRSIEQRCSMDNKDDKDYQSILEDRHIRYYGLLHTSDNRVQLTPNISDSWKNNLNNLLTPTDWAAKDRATKRLMDNSSQLYPDMFGFPLTFWDSKTCYGSQVSSSPSLACTLDNTCARKDACVHNGYFGGNTLISFAPVEWGDNAASLEDEDEDEDEDEGWSMLANIDYNVVDEWEFVDCDTI